MAACKVVSRDYGNLPNGARIDAWTLTGSSGLSLECLTYGAIVSALRVPVPRQPRTINVVLSLPSLSAYLDDQACLGAMVGRVAGRVRGARFDICGREVYVSANEGKNHLHGGIRGLSRAVWTAASQHPQENAARLELRYVSQAGEEGYPGNVEICVVYTLNGDNSLTVETMAKTDETTPLSLTNHSYFNLSGGETATVESHALRVFSNAFYPTDEDQVLSNTAIPVEGRAEDFTTPVRLSDGLSRLPDRHGAAYALGGGDDPVPAATLSYTFAQLGGKTLVLRCCTTQTCLQTYSASAFTGVPYPRHAGFCLECQGLPNLTDPSRPGNILLHPGEVQKHTTTYQFEWE